MTGLGDEWKAVDSVYLDFRKAFNSLNILMHKLEEQELHKQTDRKFDWELAEPTGPKGGNHRHPCWRPVASGIH